MMMMVPSPTQLLYLQGPLHPRQQHVQPQALAAPQREEPWMMTTIASLTQMLHLHVTLRPRVQHLSLHAPILLLNVLGHSCKSG
jgi:hypothetical protein